MHRGKTATAQYGDVYRWLKHLVEFGIALIVVFDGGRYPPKAVRAHKERAEKEARVRAEAERLDGEHPDGVDPGADHY